MTNCELDHANLRNITQHSMQQTGDGTVTVTATALVRYGPRMLTLVEAQRLLVAAVRAVQAEAEHIEAERKPNTESDHQQALAVIDFSQP